MESLAVTYVMLSAMQNIDLSPLVTKITLYEIIFNITLQAVYRLPKNMYN